MTCPKCKKQHDGKFKHCQHCLDKIKIDWQKHQQKKGINKPTNCIICGKTIEQSRMGRPKIYCSACAYEQLKNRHRQRRQHGKNN